MEEKFKKTTYQALILIIAALIIYFGLNTILGYLFGVEKPLSVVTSGSMEPNLSIGDLLIIEKVDPASLEVGDIIVFKTRYNTMPIVHRIIEIKEGPDGLRFRTKGDANPGSDIGYRTEDDIIGRVKYRIPKVGYILWASHSTIGRIIAITAILVIFISETGLLGEKESKDGTKSMGETLK